MKPATKAFLAGLSRVDWPRTLQRASTLLRALRGDEIRDVEADHVLELERAEKLQTLVGKIARDAAGCTRSKRCLCAVCAVAPIVDAPPRPYHHKRSTIDA